MKSILYSGSPHLSTVPGDWVHQLFLTDSNPMLPNFENALSWIPHVIGKFWLWIQNQGTETNHNVQLELYRRYWIVVDHCYNAKRRTLRGPPMVYRTNLGWEAMVDNLVNCALYHRLPKLYIFLHPLQCNQEKL